MPLIYAISSRNIAQGFFQAFLCGMVFFALVFAWIFAVPSIHFHSPLNFICIPGTVFWLVRLSIQFGLSAHRDSKGTVCRTIHLGFF